ncbi:MAG: MATE family efflux transporter [Bacillaceae bacterium]
MKKIDLTKGNVLHVLVALALPLMGSSLLQFTYNIIDTLWVGALGSDAVASVGSATFFIGLGYAIHALVVVGTGIKVSHAIGRKNESEAQSYIKAGLWLNFIIGLIYGMTLILFGRTFIGFLNIQDAFVEENSYYYLIISAPMLFFAFFNILYARIFSSYGNTKTALKINAIGLALNIILDPIFIYGFKLGVSGAAIATLLANGIIFGLFYFYGRGVFHFNIREKVSFNRIKEIISLGLPMSMQRILFTAVNIILARMVGTFGADAIAAQRIGLQIESITYMVIGGLNGAIASYVGQNYGAKKIERIHKGYRLTMMLGIIYTGLVTLLFLFAPTFLAGLFVREEGTILITAHYLQIIGVSLIFASIEMISNGVFTGLGVPKISATISIVFTIIRIPLAAVLITYMGVNGIWWSIAISSIVKGIAALIMYQIKIRQVDRFVTSSENV